MLEMNWIRSIRNRVISVGKIRIRLFFRVGFGLFILESRIQVISTRIRNPAQHFSRDFLWRFLRFQRLMFSNMLNYDKSILKIQRKWVLKGEFIKCLSLVIRYVSCNVHKKY